MIKRELLKASVTAGVAIMTGILLLGCEKPGASKDNEETKGINAEIDTETNNEINTTIKSESTDKDTEKEDSEKNEDTSSSGEQMTGVSIQPTKESDTIYSGSEHETMEDGSISYSERVSFKKTAFLGASRTAGLKEKLVVSDADFYTQIGITVKDVDKKELFDLKDGTKGTMIDAVCENEYDRIYLEFGINELGWPYFSEVAKYYKQILDRLKTRFPNAQIYVQSILPMVEGRTDDVYNNDNIRTFNDGIKKLAMDEQVNWIDVGPSVANKEGALPQEASNDGVHLSRDYLFKWADYLKEKTYK